MAVWTCPKCGRQFKNAGQDHYCLKPASIEEYIEGCEAAVQPRLREVYDIIKSILPDAAEKISYQMPAFWKGRNLIFFAAFKKHIGLYPGGEATTAFAEELKGYKTSKGGIQLPYDKPLPADLIARIAEWCGEHNAK